MSRVFFAESNTERQRRRRAAARKKILVDVIKSGDDDGSDDQMDFENKPNLRLNSDQISLIDLAAIGDRISPPPHNITTISSLNEDDDPISGEPYNVTNISSTSEDDDADFDEFLQASNINYQRTIYTGSCISVYNACKIIIKLARRLSLDKNKTKMLLNGIRSLLPLDNRLPRTLVGLMKILGIDNKKKVIYYCAECLTCLKTPQQTACSKNCSLNNNYRPFSNISELTINDVKSEIISNIERYINVINIYPCQSKKLLLCDVINADLYQIMSSTTSIENNQNQITILLHTDGAPIAKISGKSLWPIQATICEIPPPLRDHKEAIMILGAWLGIHHPDRNLFWTNIVEQLGQLFKNEIVLKINKCLVKFIVRIQLITFDLPALALNCNIIQYNGYNACPFCQIKGEVIDKQVFYPYSSTPHPLKTMNDYRKYGLLNFSSVTTMGIKGYTPLSDIILLPVQIAVDYMHLTCSGHVKTLIGYWHKMLLPCVFQEASEYITSVILPHNFNHQFLPLIDYNKWKTKLFRDFFIYISPIFCILFLPDKYALHFLYYFVYIRTLYHYETASELDDIDLLFDKYHKDLSTLYGPKSELFTVHLHSHLKEQVVRHGALSMTSCFPRESYLGLALSMCHGKKYVLEQYISWHLIDRSLYERNTIEVNDIFITEQFNERHCDAQIITGYKIKLIECLKKQKFIFDSTIQFHYYSRYRRGFKHYHSMVYSRAGKAISYRVSVVSTKCTQTKKKCFAEVIFYFKLSNIYYAFVKKYPCMELSLSAGLTTVVVPQNILERLDRYFGLYNSMQYTYKIIPVSDIINKVIKMSWNEKHIFAFTDVAVDWEHD